MKSGTYEDYIWGTDPFDDHAVLGMRMNKKPERSLDQTE
jgi:hypothetical protein